MKSSLTCGTVTSLPFSLSLSPLSSLPRSNLSVEERDLNRRPVLPSVAISTRCPLQQPLLSRACGTQSGVAVRDRVDHPVRVRPAQGFLPEDHRLVQLDLQGPQGPSICVWFSPFRLLIPLLSFSSAWGGYAPICLGLEDFYTRRLYLRIQVCSVLNLLIVVYLMTTNVLMWQNCFSRPIASAPDAWVDVVDRYSNDNNKTLQ
ncbi:hypothetical protein BHM03_00020391 [Ensete ventricosum]|nr:hypothetical protein BHM03_00020391 [Ensete ventricosum]